MHDHEKENIDFEDCDNIGTDDCSDIKIQVVPLSPHPVAKTVYDTLKQLDANTRSDKNVNYKKLYYHAFNGMSMILEGVPQSDPHPTATRLKALQLELEDLYIKLDTE